MHRNNAPQQRNNTLQQHTVETSSFDRSSLTLSLQHRTATPHCDKAPQQSTATMHCNTTTTHCNNTRSRPLPPIESQLVATHCNAILQQHIAKLHNLKINIKI